MIVQEIITLGDNDFLITKSDSNKYIIQTNTGVKYLQALDLVGTENTYAESDEDLIQDDLDILEMNEDLE